MNDAERSCLEVEALLPLYAGADLDGVEQDSVGEHLAACSSCRDSLAGVQSARTALLGAKGSWNAPGPDLLSDLLPSIRDKFARRGRGEGAEANSAPGASRVASMGDSLDVVSAGGRVPARGRRPFLLRVVQGSPLGVAAAAAVLVAVSLVPFLRGAGGSGENSDGGPVPASLAQGGPGEFAEIPPLSGTPSGTFSSGTTLASSGTPRDLRRLRPGERTLFERAQAFDAARAQRVRAQDVRAQGVGTQGALARSGSEAAGALNPWDPTGSNFGDGLGVLSSPGVRRLGRTVFGDRNTLVGHQTLLIPLPPPTECGSEFPGISERASLHLDADCAPSGLRNLGVDRP